MNEKALNLGYVQHSTNLTNLINILVVVGLSIIGCLIKKVKAYEQVRN